MQFSFNSDYPGVAPDGSPYETPSKLPMDFPPAQPLPCAKITTRVFHPKRNQVATVQNVLIRTDAAAAAAAANGSGDNVSWSSDDNSSSSSTSDASMADAGGGGGGPAATAAGGMVVDGVPQPLAAAPNSTTSAVDSEVRAYWIQRTVREAIYGRVVIAVVLRRRTPSGAANDNAEWEVTDNHCAVKEMSWQHIRKERDRLAEDPIKEVSAMQYLKRWHSLNRQQQQQQAQQQIRPDGGVLSEGVTESIRAVLETNIMMPLDLLSDDRHLYSVMPYCDGGELFERLDLNERFTEPEARYWMYQVLNGLENMQHAGITHRDMSLENLLVHESGALIIDMGMCLRIPLHEDVANLSTSFGNMNIVNGGVSNNLPGAANAANSTGRRRPRFLISPQGTCGKWIYMSPEIYKNQKPFDGFAVDMWAAGVILFLMLTGFPPWERACQTDERFKYMTAGYLVQMLTEWETGISSDAMDLLQRMLFLDPKDRLSLDQVRAHPWMVSGPLQPPFPQEQQQQQQGGF